MLELQVILLLLSLDIVKHCLESFIVLWGWRQVLGKLEMVVLRGSKRFLLLLLRCCCLLMCHSCVSCRLYRAKLRIVS